MIWKHVTSPTPSASKVMAMVFWDSQGVIITNYLSKGSMVTGAYYANELRELREALNLKSKQRGRRDASASAA